MLRPARRGRDVTPHLEQRRRFTCAANIQVSYTLVYKSGRQKWETKVGDKTSFFFSINPDQNFGEFFFCFGLVVREDGCGVGL